MQKHAEEKPLTSSLVLDHSSLRPASYRLHFHDTSAPFRNLPPSKNINTSKGKLDPRVDGGKYQYEIPLREVDRISANRHPLSNIVGTREQRRVEEREKRAGIRDT